MLQSITVHCQMEDNVAAGDMLQEETISQRREYSVAGGKLLIRRKQCNKGGNSVLQVGI